MSMPKLVGILNVTPDSFSDGGKYNTTDAALKHAALLIEQGVDVIDVGAESTRPGAVLLSAEEEWDRVGAIIAALCERYSGDVQLSLDTRHPENADKAIKMGVSWINDVSGADNPQMLQVLASAPESVRLVVMHHLGIPADKEKTLPKDQDVVSVLVKWAKDKLATLEAAGVSRERVILDVGIGFGKTAEQSLRLIKHIDAMRHFGVELLVGHSRKSFLLPFSGDEVEARDAATLAVSVFLLSKKVQYLRIHNAAMHQGVLPLVNQLFGR